MRAFISGHLNLTPQQFELWYVPAILRAIEAGHSFVVGDAPGADEMAQNFLAEHGVVDVTVVWCANYIAPRNFPDRNYCHRHWDKLARGRSQKEKDRVMTLMSDYDIAVSFRKGSGTANNIHRRKR